MLKMPGAAKAVIFRNRIIALSAVVVGAGAQVLSSVVVVHGVNGDAAVLIQNRSACLRHGRDEGQLFFERFILVGFGERLRVLFACAALTTGIGSQ